MEDINELISYWQSKYRLLHDWDIQYDEEIMLETLIYPALKKAYIGKWEMVCKGELCPLNLYVKHEMIHIAISMMKRDESDYFGYEETLVQDLCELINE